MRNFSRIEAWRRADNLAITVYETSRGFPREEVFGLSSQWRRAAYSVPANIAEGAARGSLRDYLHFLHVARGSLAEVQYGLHLACRLNYLGVTDEQLIGSEIRRTFACLHGLIRSVAAEAGVLR